MRSAKSMSRIIGILLLVQLAGLTVPFMGVPLALSHVAVGLWLMVKGFGERHGPLRAEAHEAELIGA